MTMTSMVNSNYGPVDYSTQTPGVLDLSRSKTEKPMYINHLPVLLPVHKFEGDLDHHSPAHADSSPRHTSPRTSVSPRCTTGHQYRDACYESPCTYNSENGSPSLYSADKDIHGSDKSSISPHRGSSQSSPNYPSRYPGPEQLSPYIIQEAFRQQLLLQKNKKHPAKSESDAVSEAGSEGSHNSFPIYPMVPSGRDGKVARPFKAYPKDPMSLAAGFSSVDALLDSQSAEKYSAFRKRMLDQICAANGGQATVSNPKMRRSLNCNGNTNNNCYAGDDGSTKGDDSYSERRKKNNAAAKKSRDRRRIKEDEIAIRAAFLERENIELKFELAAARKQLAACGIPLTQI